MSIHRQIEKFFKQKMGLWQGLPRFQRISDGTFIYGYLQRAALPSNPFLSENVMIGAVSGEIAVQNGDLILDRSSSRRFFVVASNEAYIQGIVCRYDFQAYMANERFDVQRPIDSVTRDSFTHRPTTSTYTTVAPSVYGVIGTDRYFSDMKSFTDEDVSQRFVIHNYLGIKDGDRILLASGRTLVVKINDFHTLNGYLVKSIIASGTGG